ncbi:hypothetical protein H0H93_003168 [Arthromyces matolae]|nr:hypothetical protein H0H93_003168 [Arthromyces matolae]
MQRGQTHYQHSSLYLRYYQFRQSVVLATSGVIAVTTRNRCQSQSYEGMFMFHDFEPNFTGVTETIVVAVAGDVVIAGALCFFLHRSRTGFKKSNTMITKLILFAVSAGVLTSICCIACLIAILVWPSTLIYVGFYFLLGKLYTNSLLATLNARQYIRRLGEDGGPESFNLHPSETLFSNIKFDSNPANADSLVKLDKHPKVSESESA